MAGSFSNHKNNRISIPSMSAQAREAWDEERALVCEELEHCFNGVIGEPLEKALKIGEADIVVGVPFYNEADTISGVIETAKEGLRKYFPNQKSVIVAAGSPAGVEALKEVNAIPKSKYAKQIAFLLDDERMNGKGWHERAIMEIARVLGADVAILEADLRNRTRNGEVEGLAPDWINLLLKPIRIDKADMVLSRFNRHYHENHVATHVIYPLMTAIYDWPVHDLLGGQYGISHRLLRNFLQSSANQWDTEVGGYGIDCWLAMKAITSGARICEANLGIKLPQPSPGKSELVLRRVVGTLFERVIDDRNWWMDAYASGELPLVQPPPVFGVKKQQMPDEIQIIPQRLFHRYRDGFNTFHILYKALLPKEVYSNLEKLSEGRFTNFEFPASLWVEIIYHYLLAFRFRRDFASGDLLNSFTPLFHGYVAGFALRMQKGKARLTSCRPDEAEHIVSLEAEKYVENTVDSFVQYKPVFLDEWRSREEKLEPLVPKVTYQEFVPGVPLVVPLVLVRPDGITVRANEIYESVFFRYKRGFEHFIYERLKLPRDASSQEITEAIADFMHRLEELLDKVLLPGDIFSLEGMKQVVDGVFSHFPHNDTWGLTPEMTSRILWRHPPVQLLMKFGYSSLEKLLEDYEPNDVLALSAWSEGQDYTRQVWSLVEETLRPEQITHFSLKPIMVQYEDFPPMIEIKESIYNKIAGRLVISNLHKGMGGEFPKLRYFTAIAKSMVEAERLGKIWETFAAERKDFGIKVVNSLEGHWARDPLSAHNIFENENQRVLVQRLRQVAQTLAADAGNDTERLTLSDYLKDMADSYHLAITLADGTFVPCSAWTWASYSYKGGTGLPTPLSLHIERDWSSRDFLTEYYRAVGGKEETIEKKIVELIEQGREWEDLVPLLLGGIKKVEEIVPLSVSIDEHLPAGNLLRYAGNPIIEAVKKHPWESKYVLNPGAISLNGRVYMVYRAVGEDNISTLGLAVSDDGFKFQERLEEPIFVPESPSEKNGCEDPRLIRIGERIIMLYTAYDGLVAQIALASISVKDFIDYRWKKWHRHGMVFPGFTDKDAALFPEIFNGEYAMLHRAEPHLWLTFSRHLRCPWPRSEHIILAAPRSGMVWDGLKIGAGSPPIKTEFGWLLIYHGVDYAHVYRLGVMLLKQSDPRILLYRSPNAILEPVEKYEVGEPGKGWVPNVVFTCGAVPRENHKTVLSADDELLIYYGSSDSAIGVATAKVASLIPDKFR